MRMEQISYYKRLQRDGVYHYYKVHGGGKKDSNGYQVVINFLNPIPIVTVEHNYHTDPSGVDGTWNTVKYGEEITREEFDQKMKEALDNPSTKIK